MRSISPQCWMNVYECRELCCVSLAAADDVVESAGRRWWWVPRYDLRVGPFLSLSLFCLIEVCWFFSEMCVICCGLQPVVLCQRWECIVGGHLAEWAALFSGKMKSWKCLCCMLFWMNNIQHKQPTPSECNYLLVSCAGNDTHPLHPHCFGVDVVGHYISKCSHTHPNTTGQMPDIAHLRMHSFAQTSS